MPRGMTSRTMVTTTTNGPMPVRNKGGGALIKTTIPLKTPAGKGRDVKGFDSQMFVRRAFNWSSDDQRLTKQDEKQLSIACHESHCTYMLLRSL